MRHIALCLFVPFVLACGLLEPGELTVRLEGTVTSADNGAPIDSIRMFAHFTEGWVFTTQTTVASAITDATGRYALSFGTEEGCKVYTLTASDLTVRFASQSRERGTGIRASVRCTDEVQTFDFQLERR